MSERKYMWQDRGGLLAIILLILAIFFNGLGIRSTYLYYPFTDRENPAIDYLNKNNWFYVNLFIFLDFLIVCPSMVIFYWLPKKVREPIIFYGILLGMISFGIAMHNLILIAMGGGY